MDNTESYAVLHTEFPDDSEEVGGDIVTPTGRNVMGAICQHIRSTGVSIANPSQYSFYGWEAEFQIGRVTIWFLLQSAGPQQLLIVEAKSSWLTGGKVKSDALRQGLAVVGNALNADPRIKEIRWMTKEQFETSQRRADP